MTCILFDNQTIPSYEEDLVHLDTQGLPMNVPQCDNFQNKNVWSSAILKFGRVCKIGERILVEYKYKKKFCDSSDNHIYFTAIKNPSGHFKKEKNIFNVEADTYWQYSLINNFY